MTQDRERDLIGKAKIAGWCLVGAMSLALWALIWLAVRGLS